MKRFVLFAASVCNVFRSVCSGASSDFDGATKIAKMMVTRFGMSDKVKYNNVLGTIVSSSCNNMKVHITKQA